MEHLVYFTDKIIYEVIHDFSHSWFRTKNNDKAHNICTYTSGMSLPAIADV